MQRINGKTKTALVFYDQWCSSNLFPDIDILTVHNSFIFKFKPFLASDPINSRPFCFLEVSLISVADRLASFCMGYGGGGGGEGGAWLDGIISLKLAELFQPFFSIECIKFALVSIYFKAEHTLSRQTEL